MGRCARARNSLSGWRIIKSRSAKPNLLRAAELIEEIAGGRQWAETEADKAPPTLAVQCLAEADMPDEVRAEFTAIANFITARQY